MRPIGRQCASGLSLLFAARRAFTSSAAHGCSGRPSLTFAPTSRNVVTGGPAENEGAGAASVPPPAGPSCPSPRIQFPEKSGLPSAVRGAGAVKSGLPSGVLGTPGVPYRGHCAESDGEIAVMIAIDATALSNGFMFGLAVKLRLKPTRKPRASVRGESSLGGRSAAAAKTDSKAESSRLASHCEIMALEDV